MPHRLLGLLACAFALTSCYLSLPRDCVGPDCYSLPTLINLPTTYWDFPTVAIHEMSRPVRPGGVEVVDAKLSQGNLCEDKSFQIPMVEVFPLDHVLDLGHGTQPADTDMAEHNARILITAHVQREQSNLIVLVTVTMAEDREDWTTFRGRYQTVVSVAHLQMPGCTYLDVDLKGKLRAHGGQNNHEWKTYLGTDIIRAATCLSDTPGDDAGKLGCRIFLRPIRLKIVSP